MGLLTEDGAATASVFACRTLSGTFLGQEGLEVPHLEEDAPPNADAQRTRGVTAMAL